MKKQSSESYPHSELTEKIIGAAFTVHKRLGTLFVEKVYENALVKELDQMGLKVEQQKPISVNYMGNSVGDFVVDLVVEEKVIVELKAVQSLDRAAEDKLLHYLKVCEKEVGLLINFGKKVEIKRKVFTPKFNHSISEKSVIRRRRTAKIQKAEDNNVSLGAEYIQYCRRRLKDEYLPRIEKCLEILTEEEIWWRAHETDNSIGNLVLHLSGNIRQWIVGGLGGEPDHRDRAKEFSEREHIPKKQLITLLRQSVNDVDKTLESFDPSRLLEIRHIQKYDVTCLDALSHVVEHFAQHIGQIIYITKLKKGVDLKFYNL